MLFGVENFDLVDWHEPASMSLRADTEHTMVVDDAMYISPAHLMVIPKKWFIPTVAYLLNDPAESLKLLDQMYEDLKAVVRDQIYGNKDWMEFIYGKNYKDTFEADGEENAVEVFMQKVIMLGFNGFLPSQFQLHLQAMFMPLTPQHHYLKFKHREHFHKDRWVSFQYIKQILEKLREPEKKAAFDTFMRTKAQFKVEPGKIDKNTELKDIVAFFKTEGIDYHQDWEEHYKNMLDVSEQYQMKADDFEYVIHKDAAYRFKTHDNGMIELTELAICDAYNKKRHCPALQPGQQKSGECKICEHILRDGSKDIGCLG